MKKALIVLTIFLGFVPFLVHADSTYFINNNGINMSEVKYNNLINLGFTENEILNMTDSEYESNKNIIGEVVSQSIIYYENMTWYDDSYNIIISTDVEISEEEYQNASNHTISTFGMTAGYIETTYKQLLTTISSVNDKYRYKVSLTWKKLPSVRSYDIIGLGIDTSVYIYGSVYFQQNYCYTNGACSSSEIGTLKQTSTGAGITFKLPSSSTINSLNTYLYFTVAKSSSGTLTQLKAYGDYSHAVSTITSSNAQNYSINRLGIILNSSISSYYDSMETAIATWTGSW